MNALLLHEYIERISRLFDSEIRWVGAEHNLQPIQLNALHFLNRSNRYSNTVQGVTEYLGLTKGTVSQTLATLESKGFIKKNADKKDGRVVHLNVTRAGQKLLEKTMPSPAAQRACAGMQEKEQTQLIENLKQFLTAMQKINGMNAFGICKTCRYNQKITENKFFCGLTQENLNPKDTELLCREHIPL
ncbi:MAG: MarR family transcriptional regulator [Nitrospinae bacterium CG11_big_fil_rev_8_21_14_0_20_45_15]|nr:MAG: MarR family transcriptional regulator [Nitrospinae bacterium CG11_big_fil_rev_8_21_14_0_20_45_15]